MPGHRFAAIATLIATACFPITSVADIPLAPPSAMGQTVTPVFEGWYRNVDGTFSLSFGYFNRNYVYAEHVAPILPKGTTLVITAWHDNTMENPNNPDPEQWVGWGDRTVDEMAHAWVDVTYLEQEDYESLLAAREAE